MTTHRTKTTAEKAADQAEDEVKDATTDQPSADAPAYPLSRLLKHPEGELITGARVHLIAGAFDGESLDATFTAKQVQDRVQRWLDQPVK